MVPNIKVAYEARLHTIHSRTYAFNLEILLLVLDLAQGVI